MTVLSEHRITRSDVDPGMANVPWDHDEGFTESIDANGSNGGEYAYWQSSCMDFDWQCATQEEQNLSDTATVLTGIPVRLDSPPNIFSPENIRLGGRGLRHHPNFRTDTCPEDERQDPQRLEIGRLPHGWLHNNQ